MGEKQGLVRVNARIGKQHNDWLDKRSFETGISKSSLIQLAIDNYMMQDTAIYTLQELTKKFDSLENMIEQLPKEEKS